MDPIRFASVQQTPNVVKGNSVDHTFWRAQSTILYSSLHTQKRTRKEEQTQRAERKGSRSRHLEEGPRIRAEELLDLRVLSQDLPAARRVWLVRVRPEEVRRHHPFLRLHPRAHCSLPPPGLTNGGGSRAQWRWHGVELAAGARMRVGGFVASFSGGRRDPVCYL